MLANILKLTFFSIFFIPSQCNEFSSRFQKHSKAESRIINDKKEINLDFSTLRRLPITFPHVRQLVDSIQQGLQRFQVTESLNFLPQNVDGGIEEKAHQHMRSTTTYEFFDHSSVSYHNLDSFKPKQFRSFAASHIVHCNSEFHFKEGSFLVGTKNGVWFHEAMVTFIVLDNFFSFPSKLFIPRCILRNGLKLWSVAPKAI